METNTFRSELILNYGNGNVFLLLGSSEVFYLNHSY